MKSSKRYLALLAVVLVALGVNLDEFGIDSGALLQSDSPPAVAEVAHPATGHDYPDWSSTDPNINLRHVFAGEINRDGKAVGYHARPGGVDPAGARVVAVRDGPNRFGVYTATVEIWGKRHDGQNSPDDRQRKFSTFFPNSLSAEEVVKAILKAYHNRGDPDSQPFEGPSGHGFVIQGYTTSRGGINTAFPIFVAN